MKPLHLWPLLGALTLVGGCIVSEEPLGEQVAVLKPEAWNGLWLVSGDRPEHDELVRVSVVDADKGMLAVQKNAVSCSDASAPLSLQLRQSGAWYFFHGPEKQTYYNAGDATLRAGNKLIFYALSASRVEELVELGLLPGRVEKHRVVLGSLAPEHYGVLLGGERPAWSGEPALVAVKLPAELDPCRKLDQPKPR